MSGTLSRTPRINEFVANHTGTDTNEFIELRVDPNADLSAFRLVSLEGDAGGSLGVVDFVVTPGTADAAGYWSTGFLSDRLENGTQTMLLLAVPTGTTLAQGTDLDTNDDGILDLPAGVSVVDGVAVTDGGTGDRTFAATVLTAGFDGGSFTVGGASRLPDGGDTFVRNDFDLAGIAGFTGTPAANEALNTPGAVNAPAVSQVAAGIEVFQGLLSVAEGGTGSTSIALRTRPTADVVVALTPDAQSTVNVASLTFTPDNWDVPQIIQVGGVDDTLVEAPTHNGLITVGPATSTDPAYNGLSTPGENISLLISDNDAATPTIIEINAIQGPGHVSPLVGQTVTTTGIVTARSGNGFWMQDPTPDNDFATSDAIFVFTGSGPALSVGDAVQVTGTVTEFVRNSIDPGHLSITQLTSPTVVVQSSGNALPPSVIIGLDRLPPTENTDDDGFKVFDQTNDGVDFWESIEGTRITLPNALAVSPSFNSTSTTNRAETWAVANLGADATGLNAAGGLTLTEFDNNPERIAVQANQSVLPGADFVTRPGDRLGDVTGVVDYDNRGNFEIILTQAITVTPGPLVKEAGTLAPGDANNLTVGTYNVENLAGTTAAAKFTALAADIVAQMKSPDIIALQEIQDNNGTTNDGTVDAAVTYQKLIDAIVLAGGPRYSVLNIDPANNTSGGAPGGNIRVGFLVNEGRVGVVDGSVRQVDPANAGAWDQSRIPLAADFLFNGQVVTVVNNHWASKGGSSPQFGTIQPLQNGSEDQRVLQAASVKSFVDGILAGDADAKVIVMGDLNEFPWEDSLSIVTGANVGNQVLFDLYELTEPDPLERYEYVFDGNHQILDHLLATSSLVEGGFEFQSIQLNSQFPSAQRNSDHDPAVARFTIPPLPPEAAVLAFDLYRDADRPGTSPTDPAPALWTDKATALFYRLQDGVLQDSSSATDATGDTLSRFSQDLGDVRVERVEFAGPDVRGRPAVTLDWLDKGSALLRLDECWNTIKAVEIGEFTGTALRLENWVDVLVALDDDIGRTITVDGSKRGTVRLGDGDDTVTIGVDSNNADWSNAFEIATGGGDDTIEIGRADRNYVGGRWDLKKTQTTIDAGDGDDTVVGAASRDRIDGGAGQDAVTGGRGADTFVLRNGDAEGDIITDFNAREGDLLLFVGYGAGAALSRVGDAWTVSGADGSDSFELTGVTRLPSSAVLFV